MEYLVRVRWEETIFASDELVSTETIGMLEYTRRTVIPERIVEFWFSGETICSDE